MSSYISYIFLLMLTVMLALVSSKIKNKSISILIYSFSIGILVLFMGLRSLEVGVDDFNYLYAYEQMKLLSLNEYYSIRVTEPGYFGLSYIVYLITDNFTILIFLTSLITTSLFSQVIYKEKNKISLALSLFIFITIQYFYFFGIIRLGMAASILAFAYQYLINNNVKKYLLLTFIATLFHYSAVFGLLILLISKNRDSKILLKFILIPIIFLVVKFTIYPFITAERYSDYINNEGYFNWSFINSLPFLLIFLYKIREIKMNKTMTFYFKLYILKIITEMFSPLIGIERMIWYLNISMCLLIPFTIKNTNNIFIKYLLILFTIIYCLYYSYYAYFGNSFRGLYMLPYKNILFD